MNNQQNLQHSNDSRKATQNFNINKKQEIIDKIKRIKNLQSQGGGGRVT